VFGLFRKQPEARKNPPAGRGSPVVVPIVRRVADIAAFRSKVSQAYGEGPERDEQMPVARALAGDLGVLYTYDLENLSKIVVERNLPQLGVDAAGLHAMSLAGFRAHLKGKLQVSVVQDMIAIAGLGGLECTTLLMPEIWDGLSSDFHGEVVVAVPSYALVMAYVESSADAPAERRATNLRGKGVFLEEGPRAWKAAGDHALTAQYFAWRDRTWIPAGSFPQ
jgi:hypothetical protein